MREITYIINDEEYLKENLKKEDLENKYFFKVKYTLKEDESGMSYKLTDFDNNLLNINDLTGYQRIFTNECIEAFIKHKEISDEYKDFIKVEKSIINNLEEDTDEEEEEELEE